MASGPPAAGAREASPRFKRCEAASAQELYCDRDRHLPRLRVRGRVYQTLAAGGSTASTQRTESLPDQAGRASTDAWPPDSPYEAGVHRALRLAARVAATASLPGAPVHHAVAIHLAGILHRRHYGRGTRCRQIAAIASMATLEAG